MFGVRSLRAIRLPRLRRRTLRGRETKITIVSNHGDEVWTRRTIAADVLIHELHLVSLVEKRHRLTTDYVITVSGHPSHVRELRRDIRLRSGILNWTSAAPDGAGDEVLLGCLFGLVMDLIIIPIYHGAVWIWQARTDPPMDQESLFAADGTRSLVVWSRLLQHGSEAPLGFVTVERYVRGQSESTGSTDWPDPVRESDARAYAAEHGHVFVTD